MSTVANAPTFMARLAERHEVAEHTMAFQFEKPAGWTFKAGQFVDMTLLNPPETDAEGNTRGFSISSAPHEPTIMVTTRLRDTAFKHVLKTTKLGPRGTQSAVQTHYFQVMTPIYGVHPLVPEEQADLMAFLEQAESRRFPRAVSMEEEACTKRKPNAG
jgi:hypothetical protein